MSRLIDADALRKSFKKCPFFTEVYLYYARQLIDNAPTVEITEEQAIDKLHETGWMPLHDKEMTERPTGEWELDDEHSIAFDIFKCSHCGGWGATFFRFCPKCGAKMKGGEEE